jgi:hypothetical protein
VLAVTVFGIAVVERIVVEPLSIPDSFVPDTVVGVQDVADNRHEQQLTEAVPVE